MIFEDEEHLKRNMMMGKQHDEREFLSQHSILIHNLARQRTERKKERKKQRKKERTVKQLLNIAASSS